MNFRIEQLTEDNFADFEKLTSCESRGGCYCSFWHQKIGSMQEWDTRKKENPALNRQVILDKIKTGFHVGVLVYRDQDLIAWISIGPLTDSFWTWRRTLHVGIEAQSIAGITCFTIAPKWRGQKLQSEILEELKIYGREQGWKAIEAYPFDSSAREKHKNLVLWPGLTQGYVAAGFQRLGPHWLNNPEAERSLFRFEL